MMKHMILFLFGLAPIGLVGCGEAVPTPTPTAVPTPSTDVIHGTGQKETSPTEAPAMPDKPMPNKPIPNKPMSEKPMSEKPVSDKVVRSEEEWKRLLTPEQYRVLREKGTERPFVNEFDEHFEPGVYACAACGQELFRSETKFNSGCGWPAFYAAQAGDRVKLDPDFSHGMVRTEVTCARCGSHLGHLFDDAPQTPTGQRYCINSVSLKFIPAGGKEAESPAPVGHDAPAPR